MHPFQSTATCHAAKKKISLKLWSNVVPLSRHSSVTLPVLIFCNAHRTLLLAVKVSAPSAKRPGIYLRKTHGKLDQPSSSTANVTIFPTS